MGRLAKAAAIALLVALAVVALIPRYRTYDELRRKRDRLREENRRLAEQTVELKLKEQRLVTDREFAKQVARESCMVEQGEMVFRFTNSPPESGVASEDGYRR